MMTASYAKYLREQGEVTIADPVAMFHRARAARMTAGIDIPIQTREAARALRRRRIVSDRSARNAYGSECGCGQFCGYLLDVRVAEGSRTRPRVRHALPPALSTLSQIAGEETRPTLSAYEL